jgi:hypothetical protein
LAALSNGSNQTLTVRFMAGSLAREQLMTASSMSALEKNGDFI